MQPIRRIFGLGFCKLRSWYRDPEGDWVLFSSDVEVAEALRLAEQVASRNGDPLNPTLVVRIRRLAGSDADAQSTPSTDCEVAPSSAAPAKRKGLGKHGKSTLTAEFIRHGGGVPNEASVSAGEHSKQWIVRNPGPEPWRNVRLAFVGATGCTPIKTAILPPLVAVGEEVTVSATFAVPDAEGTYTSKYKLVDEDKHRFGPPLRVRVRVGDSTSSATESHSDTDGNGSRSAAASMLLARARPCLEALWSEYSWMGDVLLHVIVQCQYDMEVIKQRCMNMSKRMDKRGIDKSQLPGTGHPDVDTYLASSPASLAYQGIKVRKKRIDMKTTLPRHIKFAKACLMSLWTEHMDQAAVDVGDWQKIDGGEGWFLQSKD
eukprot:TRINITY_DN697_c0_g1_i1.p1 TRINITY_DN697_c0_g1~~TRINITY_DN697_c0_g1_i1.p1  ORF type:complete len:374 (+),score=81.65 TRINITY_DN697_c0_g1_i1:399-1520(+)